MSENETPLPKLMERFAVRPKPLDLPLTLDMPLPPRCLNPNARVHWRKLITPKAKSKADWHRATVSQVPTGRELLECPLTVDMLFYTATANKWDIDNFIAATKAGRDGITESKRVWKDDSQVNFGTVEQAKCKPGERERVIVTVRLAGEGGA